MINSKLAMFPLTYLGLPIPDRDLTIADMDLIVHKVIVRVEH